MEIDPKKVLLVHNYYQLRGGEDKVFEDLVKQLIRSGIDTRTYTRHNRDIRDNLLDKVSVGMTTAWNHSTYKEVSNIIKEYRPSILHAINTFPMISASVFYAARKFKIPVVYQVGNYRIGCAGGTLLRNGQFCTLCLNERFPAPAVKHKCYRGSSVGSAIVASSIAAHRYMNTWQKCIDAFLVPSMNTKGFLTQFGIAAEKIYVHPHALKDDPGKYDGSGGYALYVGRLSVEKGIESLLAAWKLEPALPPLIIVGDGELRSLVAKAAESDKRIQHVGAVSPSDVYSFMGNAKCLVSPSIWMEPFGTTTIEALATGTPVICTTLGAHPENVKDGINGLHFKPNNPQDLAAKIMQLCSQTENQILNMRKEARHSYLENFVADIEFKRLKGIYSALLKPR